MSDDLVKRLRQSWDADRSIISQTDLWMTERVAAATRIEELEANLAKAVEFLDKLRNEQCYDGFELVELLRELTGGKDE